MSFFDYPEAPWTVLLIVVSLATSAFFLNRRRHIFDPRVWFPLLYGYLIYAPCLHSLWFDMPYHRGVRLELLPDMLWAACLVIVGFSIGASLAMGRLGRTPLGGSGSFVVLPPASRAVAGTVRTLSLAGALAAITGYAYFTWQLHAAQPIGDAGSKTAILASAPLHVVKGLRTTTALCTVLLVTYVIADSTCGRRLVSAGTVGSILYYAAICILGGEREFVLVAAIWFAANWNRLARRVRIAAILGGIGVISLIPILRQNGGDLSRLSQMNLGDASKSVMVLTSSHTLYTTTVELVPDRCPYWYGRSVVNAVRSFLPAQPESVDYTPMYWFAENYDLQGRSGLAFSQEAEAYLNFGLWGVPIWFGVWGLMVGTMYRRAHSPGATLLGVFLWWQSATAFMFSVRADIRTPLKIIVFGAIAVKLMSLTATLLNDYGRTRRPVPVVTR